MADTPQYEIRLRGCSKELMAKVKKLGSLLHQSTIPGIITSLINRYEPDQESIRQLQGRNSDLHRNIQKYYNKENASKEVIEHFISTMKDLNREARLFEGKGKKLVKQFGTKAKRRK